MPKFIPSKQHLREALILLFHLKKTAAESHRLLLKAYGEHAPAVKTCQKFFYRFKSGDFDVKDKERSGQPKKFEDAELIALFSDNPCQTLKELSEALNVNRTTVAKRAHKLGFIQKEGNWVRME